MLQELDSRVGDGRSLRASALYCAVDRCRLCDTLLRTVADFGEHSLASRFYYPHERELPKIPLTLCRCPKCDLVQLGQSVNGGEMWREGYGYASGLNETMAQHLSSIVDQLAIGKQNRVVLDIGCNDGTLLKAWEKYGVKRVGFDPIAQPVIGALIERRYFSAARYRALGLPKADTVTSIAMFYDLNDPARFAREVESVLAPDGIWCLEVGYVGALKEAWDGICHEHVAYYGLKQIKRIAEDVGLKIVRAKFNTANGGSIQVWLSRKGYDASIEPIIEEENALEFSTFQRELELSAKEIRLCVRDEFAGKRVYALGASTKGNTLLQACFLDKDDIAAAVDRNPSKVGRRLPGSGIPIISEDEARANPPDAFLVLPWHFRDQLLERERALREQGVKFIFPLPRLDVC